VEGAPVNAHASKVRRWFTARELVELQLPGIPQTESGTVRLAKRLNWPFRERQGRGGGREYPLDVLPAELRAAYLARHLAAVEVPAALQAEAAVEPEAQLLSNRAAEARDARLALLGLADRYAEDAGIPKKVADQHFCDLYAAGAIEVADWIRAHVRSVTPRTLFRWRQARKLGRTTRLAVDKGAARKGSGVLDRANGGEVKTLVLALIAKQPHLTADHIREIVRDRFEGGLEVPSREGIRRVPVPPLRTFQWAISQWKASYKVELTALTNPDAFKSRYRTSGRNSFGHVRRINQLWMIDASPADALLLDGRHTIYVAVDIYTRRLLIYVSKTPRAAAVGLLMRRAILAWGVPEGVKTDNGSDFTAKATVRLFAALAIEAETSTPFTPEEKAFVERAIGTVQRDLMPLLPGFIGHSVADRAVIEARKSFAERIGEDPKDAFCVELTGADLQRYCDEWTATRYAHRPHDGLGGQTPFAVAAASRDAARTVDERALDMLLAPIAGKDGLRVVTKSGIRIDHNWYLAPHVMPETQVLVRMDPADLGRALLFSPAGDDYLGEAICPALAGIDPKAAVRAARTEQKRIIDERMAGVKAEVKRLTKGPRLADLVLRQSAKESGKLIELPRARVEHTTPQIAAALDAAGPGPKPSTLWPDDAAIYAALVAQAETSEPAPATSEPNIESFPEQPKHRFRRAVELERRLDAGEQLSTTEALWLGGYRMSAEYLAHQDLHRDFGDEWLFG
jgi:transposase InsO family protein